MFSDKIYEVSKKGSRVGSKILLRRQWEGRGTLDVLVWSVYQSPKRSYLRGLEVCTEEARVRGGCSGERPQSRAGGQDWSSGVRWASQGWVGMERRGSGKAPWALGG